jgi:hypothetical protein
MKVFLKRLESITLKKGCQHALGAFVSKAFYNGIRFMLASRDNFDT